MRLGIDFGTTRTRVAAAIGGNYPLVTFQGEEGEGQDWYPSLIAVGAGQARFGPAAQAVQHEAGWEVLASFKRLLVDARLGSTWKLGEIEIPVREWLAQFLSGLRRDLVARSNLELRRGERLEALIGIPANATSTQRFLTLEAFRAAGFEVVGMLNEPSAAGIEYAHRYRRTDLSRRREQMVVYDLGGGTFDAAVISMAESQHDIVATEGIARLGGDDFDRELLDLALELAAVVPRGASSRLLALCREAKEAITPHSRKVSVDFGQVDPEAAAVLVSVAEFYARCAPLIERTVRATEAAIGTAQGTAGDDEPRLAAVYLVGGACELPALARALRERFGWRVRRSPYPSGATAIGLAIAADQKSGYTLQERFTRHFGVWREAEAGERITFDVLFPKRTPLPPSGAAPLVVRRRYRPAHNIGRFRFLECSALDAVQEPAGDVVPWSEVVFPFEPGLAAERGLARMPVARSASLLPQEIEEEYRCDADGILAVVLRNLTAGYERRYRIREG